LSARAKARKRALDFLYEADIRGGDPLTLIVERATEDISQISQADYSLLLIEGVQAHRAKIDELITTYAQGWDMDRMPAVDRNILRIAIFEILWEQDLDDQIAATEVSIGSARQMLDMTRKRRALGEAGDADVAAQEAALATAEAALPALQRSEQHQRALVAALLGRAPGEDVPALPSSTCFVLPAKVPVALPAAVVRGRPDVQAAAAAVEAFQQAVKLLAAEVVQVRVGAKLAEVGVACSGASGGELGVLGGDGAGFVGGGAGRRRGTAGGAAGAPDSRHPAKASSPFWMFSGWPSCAWQQAQL
jgi:N utilization substance protein B